MMKKNITILFILFMSLFAQAKDYKVYFKSEATDKRTNIVEPDVIFLDLNDKIIFNAKNVDLGKIIITKIDKDGITSPVSAEAYRVLVDQSFFKTEEPCMYLYYSTQYLSSGAFGLSIVGELYQKQADALKSMNHNQNFKDRVEHILNNLTPADSIVVTPPASATPPPAE